MRVLLLKKDKVLKIPNTALRFRMPVDKTAKPSTAQNKDTPQAFCKTFGWWFG
jgi:hypothetical protein